MNIEMDKLYIDNSNFKEFSKENAFSFRDKLNKRIKKLKKVLESLEKNEEKMKQYMIFKQENIENVIEAITGTIAILEELKINEKYFEKLTISSSTNDELDKDYDLDGKTNREELKNGTNPYMKDLDEAKKQLER